MYTNGFLLNKIDFVFHRDNFLGHHTHIYISRDDYQRVEAYDVDINYEIEMIIGVLGEFFEREVLVNTNRISEKNINGTNILTGKKKKVKTEYIVFDGEFVDSCGMASHINSNQLIKKSFYEFYERQSFIFSFLSRCKSKKIIINQIKNDAIENRDRYILNYVDKVAYYEIGLIDELKVVVCIGFGTEKIIGLGTARSISAAISKAQREVLQNLAISCTKYTFADNGFECYKDDEENLYTSYFKSISVEQFLNDYSYLENNSEVITDYNENISIDDTDIIVKLKKMYGIDPDIYYVASSRNIGNMKIVKVVDKNWFPHLVPKFYNHNIWQNVEKVTGKKLRRDVEIIPFP